MLTRRSLNTLVAGASLALCYPFSARASAATVEIIALGHYPVRDALKPVRAFLATLGDQVKVIEIDAESAEGDKRVKALGVKGHVPIVLVVNGIDKFKRPDGTQIEFKDFPAQTGNPLGLNGSWTTNDFEAAVKAALGK